MDIVNRLKLFMESLQIGNSQFADNCRVPRPTLSQLLNGRNKKISDEVIAKIHAAYPNLSVMWLMFGEGDMLTSPNLQFSTLQNEPNRQVSDLFDSEIQDFNTPNLNELALRNPDTDSSNEAKAGADGQFQPNPTPSQTQAPLSIDNATLASLNVGSTKKISSIVVFYTDNSFQSFAPSE